MWLIKDEEYYNLNCIRKVKKVTFYLSESKNYRIYLEYQIQNNESILDISYSSKELRDFIWGELTRKMVLKEVEVINLDELEKSFIASAVSFEEFQKLEPK